MARQEHVFTVFVASPSDVEAERGKLEDVIRELDLTWSRDLGIRLELLQWETDAYPGMGIDAQAVINEQLPDDYDLFVGIMWCRYGSPTGRAGSGTVEEFERAKARYDADPSCVKLMVYFKDELIRPSQLDPGQLAKVNEFRDSLGAEGVLYWKFSGPDHFEKLIRMHLARQVQAWKRQLYQSGTSAKATPGDVSVAEQETVVEADDLGILDLMEIFEDRFEEVTAITKRIGNAIENLGQQISDRTAEMAKLPRDSQGNANRKDAKRLFARAAADMEQYTARIDAELPLFGLALNKGMNALIRAAPMFHDLESDAADADQTRELLEEIVAGRSRLLATRESTMEFRATMAALPRMTTDLNRAKRGVVGATDRLLGEFTNGDTLLSEAEMVVRELFDELDANG